ncbi:MAG: transcription elongation factor subunit Spt4 [Nanoarchaeota archaeon]
MRKVCKKCRIFVDGSTCPICKDNQFTENWKGRILVFSEESELAQKLGINGKGEYAIKTR